MRRKRAKERLVKIPVPEDMERRRACEADVFKFLTTYFAEKFDGPWTDDRGEMVNSIMRAATVGGDQSIAAPRGEGKTTIAECVIIHCVCTGALKFPVIVAATGPHAKRILANIKYEFETNKLLCGDFPEVCCPIQEMRGAAQRAKAQECVLDDGWEPLLGRPLERDDDGNAIPIRSQMEWKEDHIILPTVEGSDVSGSVIWTTGVDGSIRGVRFRGGRPDFVLIDDPDTRESADSVDQTSKRERIIEADIAGLGGPGKKISRVLLCTLINKTCLAATYTEPRQKPSWNGVRYRLLAELPEHQEMWEDYCEKRQSGQESGDDPLGEQATKFYLDNREKMDEGAVVSNPTRFIAPNEHSTLQHCWNIISDKGWNHFCTEYQNDPPEDDGPQESGITAHMVRHRLNDLPHGVIPDGAVKLTAAIDIGKYYCHWMIVAWRGRMVGDVVDYGVQDVHNANERGAEAAILAALREWRDNQYNAPYATKDGDEWKIGLCLIDAGNWDTAIYEFVKESGHPFHASKGVGDQPGKAGFYQGKPSKDRRVGDHWYMQRQGNGLWLTHLHADHWKRCLHERWMTNHHDDEGNRRDGSLCLWGNVARDHVAFSHHQVAEVETEEFVQGKGQKVIWKKVSKSNHWLDCGYMNCAAASMAGIKLAKDRPPPRVERPREPRRRSGGWVKSHKGRW